MFVRGYAAADGPRLYEICLRTADAGEDATTVHADPSLPGHVWLGQYLALVPDLAWVVDDGRGSAAGYVVGALDTRAFEQSGERSWWPRLREQYPLSTDHVRTAADEALVQRIHRPDPAPAEIVEEYPSHLHIDLLPEARGGGHGRVLIDTLCAVLGDRGSAGVFVGVAARNTNAVDFYRHVQFVDLLASDGAVWLGRRLG